MNWKNIILIGLLLTMSQCVTVGETDKCSECTQMKSKSDCSALSTCTWTDKNGTTPGSCAKTVVEPQPTYKSFCEQIATPEQNCAKTFGCAYVNGKCTHFTGCTAYVKTTVAECKAISYQCVTNGVTCDIASECNKYTQDKCETYPGLNKPYQYNTCREMYCSEAAETFSEDKACDNWKPGCVTTGVGCADQKSLCSDYKPGTATCDQYIGSDGRCTVDSTTTTKCKLRVCSEAAKGINSDEECKKYQDGCITNGNGCTDKIKSCSEYIVTDINDCNGIKGSDGPCIGDTGGSKCRAKKCEDTKGTTDSDCKNALESTTCLTDGIQCVSTLQLCNSHKGTKTDCNKRIGSDGKCKGTSDTDANASCVVRDCTEDATKKENSDAACKLVQSYCLTTGFGCAKTLQSCSTYTDNGDCDKWVGSEGKCKKGANSKCAPRQCQDDTTSTTNEQCGLYKLGCVTNGQGCTDQQVCIDTVNSKGCSGSTDKNCAWYPICTGNQLCSDFGTKSLCLTYKVDNKACFWEGGKCRNAKCTDFKFTDNQTCEDKLSGCVTNSINCVDPQECAQFKGITTTCEGFSKYCTNISSATATTACIARTCENSPKYTTNDECLTYSNQKCLTNLNGCISINEPCSSYTGTASECDNFTGYVNSTTRVRCWNTSASSGTCTTKQCHLATNMTGDSDCETFLSGCIWNGNTSCILQSAPCSSFQYKTQPSECQGFKGENGEKECYDGSFGYCKTKACTDDTTSTEDSNCENFLPGCVTKGLGCISKDQECSSYSGVASVCEKYTGNEKKCTRYESCKEKVCSGAQGVETNADCLDFHSKCRLQFGTTTCIDSKANCADYTLSGTDVAAKQTYCNLITKTDTGKCSYSVSADTVNY